MTKTIVQKRFDNKALFEFMIKRLGGEAAVMKEFYGARIAQMASEGMALADLLEEAQHNSWRDELERMKMKDLAEVINPSTAAPAAAPSPSKRLTKKQKAKALDDTLVFLADHPWTSKNEIAEGIGFDTSKLGALLRAIKEDDKVKTVGERSGMKYALASEKSKP